MNDTNEFDLGEIDKILGYKFRDSVLRARAFTHASYVNENPHAQSNERLEFLGDAVLKYVLGLYLYQTYPNLDEGSLTKMRASLEQKETLAKVVDKLDLIKYLRIRGDNPVGLTKKKCDLFEAVVGAILIDSNNNLKTVTDFILKNLAPFIGHTVTDFKSQVFEMCSQNKKRCEIKDKTVETNGISTFVSELFIDGSRVGTGEGTSKKRSQQAACEQYLKAYQNS